MKRMWTIIGVADVPRSFKWYQSLLAEAGHDMDRLREVEACHHSIENERRGYFLG
jgi:hypothetical protein